MLGRIVTLIIAAGVIAGLLHLAGAGGDSWSPRDYVAAPGGVIVYPQGDPLYDEHYAKNVNVPNSSALLNQSEAHYMDALAREVNNRTTQSNIGLGSFALVLVLVVIGFTAALLKK